MAEIDSIRFGLGRTAKSIYPTPEGLSLRDSVAYRP
jgi:hypothetical protein